MIISVIQWLLSKPYCLVNWADVSDCHIMFEMGGVGDAPSTTTSTRETDRDTEI